MIFNFSLFCYWINEKNTIDCETDSIKNNIPQGHVVQHWAYNVQMLNLFVVLHPRRIDQLDYTHLSESCAMMDDMSRSPPSSFHFLSFYFTFASNSLTLSWKNVYSERSADDRRTANWEKRKKRFVRIQLLSARKGSSRAHTNRQIKSSMNNNNSLSSPLALLLHVLCCCIVAQRRS